MQVFYSPWPPLWWLPVVAALALLVLGLIKWMGITRATGDLTAVGAFMSVCLAVAKAWLDA